jgi:sec-independent protein translocase protein TatB
MLNIGPQELILILVVALVIVGPKKLPELARAIGRGMNEFRKIQDEVKDLVSFDLSAMADEPEPADGSEEPEGSEASEGLHPDTPSDPVGSSSPSPNGDAKHFTADLREVADPVPQPLPVVRAADRDRDAEAPAPATEPD